MMKLSLVISIHGILTRQTVADWPDRFDAWCAHQQVDARVLKKEYIAGPFPLWNVLVKNRLLARGLAAEVELFFRQNSQNEQNSPGGLQHAASETKSGVPRSPLSSTGRGIKGEGWSLKLA